MGLQQERTDASFTVDAERHVSIATTQLVRFHLNEPRDDIRREEEDFWLDMCLTPRPRNARACFVERWVPHRFERIGPLFMLPPRQTFHVLTDGGSSQASVLCHLKAAALSDFLEHDLSATELKWTDERLRAGLNIPDKSLQFLMSRLAAELRAPGFAGATLLELLVAQISIELMRYCASIAEQPSSGTLASWRLRLIEERLRDVHAAPTLTELSELCNLSVRQLTRAFRASRGRSIHEYVAERRIEHAKRLLAAGEPVKSVGHTLGFSTASSFSYAFRVATGQSPRAYRTAVARSTSAAKGRPFHTS